MRTKSIGRVLLAMAGSLLLAGASFAGAPDMRLNGGFLFEDDSQGDDNEACVITSFTLFFAEGRAIGTSGDCTVTILWDALVPTKASGSVLKDDGAGTAKVSQQVQTSVLVAVQGGLCPNPFGAMASPEKCKASGQVKAEEPSETLQSAKASLSCDLGEDLSELGSPSQAVIDTIADAFADRSDVKLGSNGKLTIKTKGVPNSGVHFCI